MSNRDRAHSLTVRLPRDLYLAARNIAVRRGKSVNILVQESLRRAIEAEEQEELRRGFELLSEAPAECDVEYAFEAQREVVLRDDP
jgi:hypothetical protein